MRALRYCIHTLSLFRLNFNDFEFFNQILEESAKNPNVIQVCTVPNRLNALQMLTKDLEECQKLLNDYLDAKRHVFPRSVTSRRRSTFILSTSSINCCLFLSLFDCFEIRFYFISIDELLSILGSSEPMSVQRHINKVCSLILLNYYIFAKFK